MKLEEIREATLHRVIEVTLDGYLDDCKRDGHRKDKSGYTGQMLSKVDAVRPKLKVEE